MCVCANCSGNNEKDDTFTVIFQLSNKTQAQTRFELMNFCDSGANAILLRYHTVIRVVLDELK